MSAEAPLRPLDSNWASLSDPDGGCLSLKALVSLLSPPPSLPPSHALVHCSPSIVLFRHIGWFRGAARYLKGVAQNGWWPLSLLSIYYFLL